MIGGADPLTILEAALERAGHRDDVAEGEPRGSAGGQRFGALQSPATARLYGPHGLLVDDRPAGGAGSAAVVSVGGEVVARRGGPAFELSRMPVPEVPRPERRPLIASEAPDSGLAGSSALERDGEDDALEIHSGQPSADPLQQRRGVGRYLEVERSKLGLPLSLAQDRGALAYGVERTRDAAIPAVRRKAPPSSLGETGADE